MKIQLAHVRGRSTTGGFIDFVVFKADVASGLDSDRDELLKNLTTRVHSAGLSIEKSALAFREHGRVMFYGTPDLVEYLASKGVPRWTHRLDV